MAQVSISIAGEQRVDMRLAGIEGRSANATAAFALMAREFDEEETRLFESEGSYGAGAWEPLSPAYEAQKAREYPGETILQREHRLVESLIDPGSSDAIRTVGPHEAVFGTSVEYASYHQEGTERMPARPPLDVSWDVMHRWTEILHAHIMGHEVSAASVAGL